MDKTFCKSYLVLLFVVISNVGTLYAQRVAMKTDLLMWLTTTPNAAVEFAMGRHLSLEVGGAYNAWKLPKEMKLNNYIARPELRYWFRRSFEGHFIGLHPFYGHFNVGLIPFISSLKNHIFRGDFYGGGISYGYHRAWGKHWGIEATLGAGYTRIEYDKYLCVECAEQVGSYRRNYFGPTRVSVSLIYMIR